jgi:multiple sugar transport system substrate-binding protein
MHVSRRDFLKISGFTAAAATAAACAAPVANAPSAAPAAGGEAPAAAEGDIVMQWWDHYLPLQPLSEAVFAAYHDEHPNVTVEYTVYSPPDLGQALQLAYPNDQAPDVHALAGINVPVPALQKEGWFAPLQPYADADWVAALPPEVLIEGRTTFDGVLYSFPIFTFRSHSILTWFNIPLLEEVGVDPEVGPVTWDDFRETARKITENSGGTVFGWIQGVGHIDRMSATLVNLAQLAGAPGEIDWSTGEYIQGSDPFVNALEFLVSMQSDGSLFPTSTTIDTRNARARWAAGDGVLFLDGSWNIGVVQGSFPEMMDKTGVSQAPVPDAGTPAYTYALPKTGDFWISSQSDYPQHAAAILQHFTSEDYQIKLAERMDQPPLDANAVQKANVHPTYSKAIKLFGENVRLAPDPLVKNPTAVEVDSRMNDVRPNLGEIVQGAIAGEVTDIAATLKDYQDKMSAERERAQAAAKADGFDVSSDSWVFPNWEPGVDYTADMYS